MFKIITGISSPAFRNKLNAHKGVLNTLYQSLAKNSGNDVIVDSSKLPSRALILNQIPGIEVYVVHLVRDVRGVIYSWNKQKWDPSTGGYLRRYRPGRTLIAWVIRNLLTELLAKRMPYLRLNYEDWVHRPKSALQEMVDLLEPTAGKILPFESENEIQLGPIHSVRGNPDRFASGLSIIQLDDVWTHKLDKNTERLARLFSFPLLRRYGYKHDKAMVWKKNAAHQDK